MNFPQKIMLENRIFTCAEGVHASIHARAGRLLSCSTNEYLQALLQLYNAFFCKDNWEEFCRQESLLEGLCDFKARPVHTPVFSTKDYKFELIMGEKNA